MLKWQRESYPSQRSSTKNTILLTSFVAFFNLTHTINGYTRFYIAKSAEFWRALPISTQGTLPCVRKGGQKNWRRKWPQIQPLWWPIWCVGWHPRIPHIDQRWAGQLTVYTRFLFLNKNLVFINRFTNQIFKCSFIEDNAQGETQIITNPLSLQLVTFSNFFKWKERATKGGHKEGDWFFCSICFGNLNLLHSFAYSTCKSLPTK